MEQCLFDFVLNKELVLKYSNHRIFEVKISRDHVIHVPHVTDKTLISYLRTHTKFTTTRSALENLLSSSAVSYHLTPPKVKKNPWSLEIMIFGDFSGLNQ